MGEKTKSNHEIIFLRPEIQITEQNILGDDTFSGPQRALCEKFGPSSIDSIGVPTDGNRDSIQS